MNTKDTPTALAPVYIDLPTVGQHGTINNEVYLNTGLLTARDEQIIRSKPYKHRVARIIYASGGYLMVFPIVGLLISVILWESARYAQPGMEAMFVPWGAAAAVVTAAEIAAMVVSSRVLRKDGDRHEGAIATSVTVPDMLLASDLPANIQELAAELARHRTASHGLRTAPAFDAYTAALTAVANAAQAYANLDPDAATALATTRLHHIPEVKALADKHAAALTAAKEAENAAHQAVHAFSDATDEARVLAAATAQ